MLRMRLLRTLLSGAPAVVGESLCDLRLKSGNYRATAEAAGLSLHPEARQHQDISDAQLPPGFIYLD